MNVKIGENGSKRLILAICAMSAIVQALHSGPAYALIGKAKEHQTSRQKLQNDLQVMPLIQVVGPDEEGIVIDAFDIAQEPMKGLGGQGHNVWIWSETTGLVKFNPKFIVRHQGKIVVETVDSRTKNIRAALEKIKQERIRNPRGKDVFILRGTDGLWDKDHEAARAMKELAQTLNHTHQHIIMVEDKVVAPSAFEREMFVMHYDLPTKEELGHVLRRFLELNRRIFLTDEERAKLLDAAVGLSAKDFNTALRRADHQGMDLIEFVFDQKVQVIKKTQILEYIETNVTFADVGGMENVEQWAKESIAAMLDPDAEKKGIKPPKGTLLLGLSGGGKSLAAKAIAGEAGLPLIRFDLGKVFGKYVGESEARMDQALKVLEAMQPCVVWFDEVEKLFSGSTGDSGVSDRVVAKILTWLQENQSKVLVIMTANDVRTLRPELTRAGRLDAIFFIYAPKPKAREKIFRVHLGKAKQNVGDFDIEFLVSKTEGYTGAEIESAIQSALRRADYNKRALTTEEIHLALKRITPVSVSRAREIQDVERWAEGKAQPAGAEEAVVESSQKFDSKIGSPEEEAAMARLQELMGKEGGQCEIDMDPELQQLQEDLWDEAEENAANPGAQGDQAAQSRAQRLGSSPRRLPPGSARRIPRPGPGPRPPRGQR
jgi:SpoVK/Ycf46/Vps4 family AAA+-type ATPase